MTDLLFGGRTYRTLEVDPRQGSLQFQEGEIVILKRKPLACSHLLNVLKSSPSETLVDIAHQCRKSQGSSEIIFTTLPYMACKRSFLWTFLFCRSSSLTAPNPSILGTAGLLPPIEARNRSNSSGDPLITMKDSIKNINAVAARRRSVRTAEQKNVETWQNNWMKTGKTRGSSV